MKIVGYAIRHKPSGKLLGFSTVSNDGGEFCEAVSYSLELNADNTWVTYRRDVAERVAKNGPTPWYNASFDSPEYSDRLIGELEVVEVGLVDERKQVL